MSIAVTRPALQVVLYKLLTHRSPTAEPWQDARRRIDLTPHLGDGSRVKITLSLKRQQKPVTIGAFSISFGDRLDADTQDSIARLIEPMDLIEIRAARHPENFAGAALPLIMRGFVDSISRTETPNTTQGNSMEGLSRTVVVTGADTSKLLNNCHINMLAEGVRKRFVEAFSIKGAKGLHSKLIKISDFMTTLIEQVVNPNIAQMSVMTQRAINPFSVQATVPVGGISPSIASISGFQGSLWALMNDHADGPWNELFVRETEEGPILIFRPTPYKDLAGALIMAGATDPGTIHISDHDILRISMRRSDQRLANYFTLSPGTTGSRQTVKALSIFDDAHGNNSPALFGLRKMDARTALLSGTNDSAPAARSDQLKVWLQSRLADLRAMNRDNLVLEEGMVNVIGREDYQIGTYLRMTRGAMVSEAYIETVSHVIAPLSQWSTELSLVRGTGFLSRVQLAAGPSFDQANF